MKNKHRNHKGQYDILSKKAELLFALAMILSVFWWHVNDANKSFEQHRNELAREVAEAQALAGELEHQAALLSNPDLSRFEHEMGLNNGNNGFLTAYSCGTVGREMTDAELSMNCPSRQRFPSGRTATGTTPLQGRTIACDPANSGRTFYIEGIGERTCEDTGDAIKGAGRFDIYLADIDEAKLFASRESRYYLIDGQEPQILAYSNK